MKDSGKMRAVILKEHGDPGVVDVESIPEGAPNPSQILVRIGASGLNRLDSSVRRGAEGPGLRPPPPLPHVMGADGAGVVTEIGDRADTRLAAGDRVMVFPGISCEKCRYCRRGETSKCKEYRIIGEDVWGVQRERIWLDPGNLYPIPEHMSIEDAAAVPVAYTTAWTMLQTAGQLRVGERVLILGGTGGVGSAAIQIAVQSGAEVLVASRGPGKREAIASLTGVTDVIDNGVTGWWQRVDETTGGTGVDIVVESVGSPTWRESIRCLAVGGRMVVCGATGGDQPDISIREIYQSHRRIIGAPFGGWSDFVNVVEMISRTRMRPQLDAVFPIEDAAEAHRRLDGSEHMGKIVLQL